MAFAEEPVEDATELCRLLKYLPGIYADDLFLDGFLRLFDATWQPIERQIGQLHRYFDPRLTPSDLLPWLGTWVDLVLDENWPEPRRRALIYKAADLYRRRGTAGALRDYLAIYTGVQPEIIEDGDDQNPYHFTVRLRVADAAAVDEERIRRIIDEEKPAHTIYTLQLEKG
jgi:phage tail-like protein